MVSPPSSPAQTLQEQLAAAIDLHRAGRLAEAEQGYRFILRQYPDHAGSPVFHASLGDILRQQGRMGEAAASFCKSVLLRPDLVDGWNSLGLALRALGHGGVAAAALRRCVALMPDAALAHNNLGLLLGEGGAESFRRALVCAPNLTEAHANLGLLRQTTAPLRRAVALRPHASENWYALAGVDSEDGLAACRTALALQPGHGQAHNLAGLMLVEKGDLLGAARHYRRAVACEPDPTAYANLAAVTRFSAKDPHLAAMEHLADREDSLSADGRIALHFALGKAYGDCCESGKAFGHYQAANRRKRDGIAYDESAELATMERARRAFDGELFARLAGQGDESAVPVFILGMPRSGSTLIEQILASHPKVRGAGERPDFPELLGQIGYPEPAAALAGEGFRALGAAYAGRMRSLAPEAERVIDKLPGNFLYAGAIHLALPNARIIHSRRDPADTCLSCFTTLFRGEQLPFTYDLGELGRYYRAYARLMAHWRAVLPPAVFLEVDYEALVADPEAQTRRLLAHCGLAWDPACLDFHRTRREVRTASAAQVRRPLYGDSVGRWRRYGDLLEPLLSELEKA